jgi:hypothetical protein
MKIREIVNYNTTTIAHLQPYDMFILTSPRKIYMYIMTLNHGPKYLELVDGCWKDTGLAFHINEPVSIIEVETLEYKKRAI